MWNSFGALGLGTLARWSDSAANWAVDHGYPAIMVIVAGDGVIPLFPGETVVVTGGNIANQGKLSLLLVIVAGFVGAIVGDNIAYWIVTALFSAFMVFSSIGGITLDEQAVTFLHDHLGYPLYFIRFISCLLYTSPSPRD